MAIKVGYYEDQTPEHYEEGPFVLVDANGWRIEIENPQGKCSFVPAGPVWDWMEDKVGRYIKSRDEEEMAKRVDTLNALAKTELTRNDKGSWTVKPH